MLQGEERKFGLGYIEFEVPVSQPRFRDPVLRREVGAGDQICIVCIRGE